MSDTTLKAIRHPDGSYGCVDELLIRAPQEKIFETLRDFNGREQWGPNKARITTGEPRAEVGSEIDLWIGGQLSRLKVTALKTPQFFTFQVTGGPFKGECEWQVVPGDGGFRARLIWKTIYPQTFLLRVLLLFTGSRFHSRAAGQLLHALKKHLEG